MDKIIILRNLNRIMDIQDNRSWSDTGRLIFLYYAQYAPWNKVKQRNYENRFIHTAF